MKDENDRIDRKRVTEPQNFVWIPTGYAYGVPTGIVGYWEGDKKGEAPIINFPEGNVALSSQYTPMYEPTEQEIEETIDRMPDRWAERFGDSGKEKG